MVLEEKMRLDQIPQDGVVLKPFKDIIAAKVTDVDLGASCRRWRSRSATS